MVERGNKKVLTVFTSRHRAMKLAGYGVQAELGLSVFLDMPSKRHRRIEVGSGSYSANGPGALFIAWPSLVRPETGFWSYHESLQMRSGF